MRFFITCDLEYGADLEKVEHWTKEVIAANFSQNELRKDVEFYFTEFGDSSINFLCRFWVDSKNALENLTTKRDALIKIKQAIDKENMNIPFSMRTLEFVPNQSLHLQK